MNAHGKQLAGKLVEKSKENDENLRLLEGYHEIQYRGESWPLDGTGIYALPTEVTDGQREAAEEEKLAALKAQGYTLND